MLFVLASTLGKVTLLYHVQYCSHQKLSESKAPLNWNLRPPTSLVFVDLSKTERVMAYGVFVKTCAHTLLSPHVWKCSVQN